MVFEFHVTAQLAYSLHMSLVLIFSNYFSANVLLYAPNRVCQKALRKTGQYFYAIMTEKRDCLLVDRAHC